MKLLVYFFVFIGFIQSACAQNASPSATTPPHPASPADTVLNWKNFPEGIAEAEATGKKIMLFIYTDWCGYCRKFQREVYTEPDIIEYLNQNFAIVKINAESEQKMTFKNMEFTEAELALSLKVTGFPTHVFMEPGGEKLNLLHALPGFMAADYFKDVLRYFKESAYEKQSFDDFLQAKGK